MKKIIITEEQYQKILGTVINEQEDPYEARITPSIWSHGCTYKGAEINDITTHPFNINFDIDIEHRRFGIKGIAIYGIRGPQEMELSVSYYPDGDDSVEEIVTIPIDWSADYIKKENDNTAGWIGISEVDITLKNTEDGGLAINEILISLHQL